MARYINAFDKAWAMLTEWVASEKFAPRNEEDIQCFLFHGLVVELGTALGVRTKASSGDLWMGTKHFPDFVLGLDSNKPELIVEIKYRPTMGKNIFNGCKNDIEKMKKYYDSQPHRFVLFDESRYCVFLDQHQYDELASTASSNCQILHYPYAFKPSLENTKARQTNKSRNEA